MNDYMVCACFECSFPLDELEWVDDGSELDPNRCSVDGCDGLRADPWEAALCDGHLMADEPWAPEPGDPGTYDEDDVTTWSEWLSGTFPPVAHGG